MFEEITNDSTSGASRLARLAALELAAVADSLKDSDPGTFWEEFVSACSQLVAAKREMAPILNLVGAALSAAERVVLSGRGAEVAAQAVRLECSRVADFGEEHLSELGSRGVELLDDGAVVATLSDGESVRAVIQAAVAVGTRVEALVSESRPGLEGVTLARHLAGLGVTTRLVTDAALPGMISEASILLVGADSVSENGLVNKTGTYAAALAARDADVPTYAAALRSKFIPGALRGDPGRPRDGAEVLAEPPAGLTVVNRYFETVPLALIRAVVTEDGPVTVERIPEMLRERPVSPALLQVLFAHPDTAEKQA